MSADGAVGENQQTLIIRLNLVPEVDEAEAERLGQQLRREIDELDVENVRPTFSVDVPNDAKGGGVDWGQLLLTFGAAGGVFTSVIALVHEWLNGHVSARRISMTIDGDTMSVIQNSVLERVSG